MGMHPAASLINYGQTRRKESRHKDRHPCGVVGRVITFMAEKRGQPGGRQKHIETDKYNRSTLLVRLKSERKQLSQPADLNINKLKPGWFRQYVKAGARSQEVREMD